MKKKQVEELNKILESAGETTPHFLNGLLIPQHDLHEFIFLINVASRDAVEMEDYRKRWYKSVNHGSKINEGWIMQLIRGNLKITEKSEEIVK